MKYYISGPMTGIEGHNYPRFQQVAEELRSRHHEIVSPHELTDDFTQDWEWYLKRDLKSMLDCDRIILLEGWEASRGARLELWVADKLKMVVCTLSE